MARGIWITHVRNGETENQDFIPFGPLHAAELSRCRDKFQAEMIDGDTIEEYEGEN